MSAPNARASRDEAIAAVRKLHDFLRSTRPVWTNDFPTREGFYWCQIQPDHRAMVVEVRVDYSEPETPFVAQIGHPAFQGVQYLRDFSGCLWAGPLERPVPRTQ
jgi:hypothetical protein